MRGNASPSAVASAGLHAAALLLLASELLLFGRTAATSPAVAQGPRYSGPHDRHENALELIGVQRTTERWADPAFLTLAVRSTHLHPLSSLS